MLKSPWTVTQLSDHLSDHFLVLRLIYRAKIVTLEELREALANGKVEELLGPSGIESVREALARFDKAQAKEEEKRCRAAARIARRIAS